MANTIRVAWLYARATMNPTHRITKSMSIFISSYCEEYDCDMYIIYVCTPCTMVMLRNLPLTENVQLGTIYTSTLLNAFKHLS